MKTSDYGKYYPEDFQKVTTNDIIKELAREQEMRINYYKKLIEAGKMKRETAIERFRIFRVMLHLFNKAEFNDLEPENLKKIIEENFGNGPKQKKMFDNPQQPN